MPEVADDALPPAAVYAEAIGAGAMWVVEGDDGAPVAFALVEQVDGDAHVEQLSLDPRWSRRGIGRALLDHVSDRARADGRPAVTLTTFVSVPWNAPYYRRLGFTALDDRDLGLGLGAILEAERRRWVGPRHARVAMRRPV